MNTMQFKFQSFRRGTYVIRWALEAYYLAQAVVSYTLVLRPERIILAGLLLAKKHLKNEFKKQIPLTGTARGI
ncbi:ROK family protein [Sporolactobacillus terrae]|uniref:ROK family protein n=1 Tax=Sporolactobacillus terrae TaxID=269673 RepID=UPI000491503C|nr:ROK family protein [Sporolactobacillus terrae]